MKLDNKEANKLKNDFIEKIKSEIPEYLMKKRKDLLINLIYLHMKQTFWFLIKRHQNILKKL